MKTPLKTASALVVAAHAEYPEKPAHSVVPFPPDDLGDVLTRPIAENLQEKYGVAPTMAVVKGVITSLHLGYVPTFVFQN